MLSRDASAHVLKQTIVAPSLNVSQYYSYDAVNRLEIAAENPRGAHHFHQSEPHAGSLELRRWRQPDQESVFAARDVPVRRGEPPGAFLHVGGGRGADCNSLQTAGRTLYSYDAEGHRVKQQTSSRQAIHFIYDAFGQLAAEYGGTAAASTTQYLTADHLGTTRVVSDAAQSRKCQDYLPFGAEISVGGGSPRAASPCYGQDLGVRLKFTGKERDAETGLDYFGARYMSAAQGRFTSPDPPGLDQSEDDPQSWNLYSYVRNNPLRFIDPTG